MTPVALVNSPVPPTIAHQLLRHFSAPRRPPLDLLRRHGHLRPPVQRSARRVMEAAAGLAMQSWAVGIGAGTGGRRDAVLGGCVEKWARTGTLRIGGPAGATTPAVAVRARGDKPVASLCCLDIQR